MLPKYMLVAFGNPVFDIIETPYIRTNGRVLSGCSINAALAVGKLGGKAIVIGSVGDDYRDKMLDKLGEYGVEAYVLPSRETGGFYLKYIDESMNDRTLRVIGHAEKIRIDGIPEEILDDSECILFGPILDELSVDMARGIANNSDDKLVIVDPQGFIRIREGDNIRRVYNPDIKKVIDVSDVFKPNEHEAEVIFGDMSPIKIAKKIVDYGAEIGIVTLAEKGSIIAFSGKVYKILAYKTIAKDPTGCGDVYAGGFVYKYLKSNDAVEAAAFASAVASFMVETTGPDFKIDRKELARRFEWIYERVERVE